MALQYVILSRDDGRRLQRCIDSIVVHSPAPGSVCILNSGSGDLYTRQILRQLASQQVKVIDSWRYVSAEVSRGGTSEAPSYLWIMEARHELASGAARTVQGCLERLPKTQLLIAGAEGDADLAATDLAEDGMAPFVHIGSDVSLIISADLWERLGGLDAEASPYEIHDLWMAAAAAGVASARVEHILVRSAPRRPMRPGAHQEAAAQLLRKHRGSVEAVGPGLVMRKTSLLARARERQRAAAAKHARLREEFEHLRATFGAHVAELRRDGGVSVDFGDLNRVTPLSAVWGTDRGEPVDRYYIHKFLYQHRGDIRGHVLEVKDSGYTDWFGGAQVAKRDVVDIDASNPAATIVADLAAADAIEASQFDCFIMTQTLHIIYDTLKVVAHAARLLKPGGVLLCTVPAVSRINYEDGGLDGGDYWRFTEASLRRLFADVFPIENVAITPYGNVQVCTAFLYGLSSMEMDSAVLDHHDPWFPLGYCIRALRPDTDSEG